MSESFNNNHPILQSLNDAQCAAVSAPDAHRLVLAGAGSGKTSLACEYSLDMLKQNKIKKTERNVGICFQ